MRNQAVKMYIMQMIFARDVVKRLGRMVGSL